MTEPGKDEGGRDKDQVVKDLASDNTVRSTATASGLAALGSPEGKETAKTTETNSGIKPDAVGEGQAPQGLQAEAAFFTRNGSIPANSIPSPSGPVPASTIADEATRNAAVEAARAGARSSHQGTRNSRQRVSDEAAARMSPAELRAVGHDRGYGTFEGGRQSVLRRFLDAQQNDKGLEDPPEGSHLGIQAAPVPVNAGAGLATGNPLTTPSQPGGLKTPAGTLRNTDGTPASATPPTSTPDKK